MFNDKVLDFRKRAHLASTSFNKYAAWKAYAFVIFSALLYEILIFFKGLNSSFFIFQIKISLRLSLIRISSTKRKFSLNILIFSLNITSLIL